VKAPTVQELKKLLMKLPVERRLAIIRVAKIRGTFKLIRGGRYDESKAADQNTR
jgi:hypothetical protein